MLTDIYGVHKAMKFGLLQRTDYSLDEFISDIENAEENVFGDTVISDFVEEAKDRFRLSLYPLFLVKDDIFATMACHFAVSAVVNELTKLQSPSGGLYIRSVVVPGAAQSRYDEHAVFPSSIENIGEFLRNVSRNTVHASSHMKSDISEVPEMTDLLMKMIKSITETDTKNIVIVFDRSNVSNDGTHPVRVFECSMWSDLDQLTMNYFTSFDFQVSVGEETENIVRCWLNFGVGERLRFYPEYSVWIIPHLFVHSTTKSAQEMMKALYNTNYKHGWRVALDDGLFNKYYHIITGYEHVSNNYKRADVEVEQKFGPNNESGLRDHLESTLEMKQCDILRQLEKDQLFDSDAIFEDLVSIQHRIRQDANDSNIVPLLLAESANLRKIQFQIYKFENITCGPDSVHQIDICQQIDAVIQNLKMFKECGLVIDAVNVSQFTLKSIVNGFDHMIKVHDLLSDQSMKEHVQNYVAQHIVCDLDAKCPVLAQHAKRSRERVTADEKSDEALDEVESVCELIRDAMNSLHCYVLHRRGELYRLTEEGNAGATNRFATDAPSPVQQQQEHVDDDDESDEIEYYSEEEEEDDEEEPIGINFGYNILRWLSFGTEPDHETLKDEIIRNPESTIDRKLFNHYEMMCIDKINGTEYTLNELLCLKLYSDTNELQAQLRRAHWTVSAIEVRKAYYQWAMGLYRAHLYHAAPIQAESGKSRPRRLYHGLSRLFTMSRELPIYFGPFSTTMAKEVATRFSNAQGLIWLIHPTYDNPLRFCIGIKMTWISCHKNEEEVLLYNQYLPIQKTDTFDDDTEVLVNHLMFSLKSRALPIVEAEMFWKQLGIRFNTEWIPQILNHKLLYKVSDCKKLRIIERLRDELHISFFEMKHYIEKCLMVTDDDVVCLRPGMSKRIDEEDLAFSDFAFGLGFTQCLSKDADSFMFESVDKFVFHCADAFSGNLSSLKCVIFCKSTEDSFDFVPIHSTILPRYQLPVGNSLVISNKSKILPFDEERGRNGSLLIKCSSDITFAEQSSISGKGVGENSDGGIIRVISGGTVKNLGSLCCNGLDGARGGDIYIVADSFINRGKMKCEPDGQIYVFCRHFSNDGKISPPPNVINMIQSCTKNQMLCEMTYLLHSLVLWPSRITDKGRFYRDVGVRVTNKSIQVIVDHDMLFAISQFDGKRVIERLSDELCVEFFGFFDLVCDIFFIDEERNVKAKAKLKEMEAHIDDNGDEHKESDVVDARIAHQDRMTLTGERLGGLIQEHLKHYVFAMTIGHGHPDENGEIFEFQSVSEFSIPLRAALGIDQEPLYLHVHSRHEDEDEDGADPMGFIRISTLQLDDAIVIEHFLDNLLRRDAVITDSESFYREIGVRFYNHWCPSILNHQLYSTKTQYKGNTIGRRLSKELKVSFFQVVDVVRECATVEGENVIVRSGATSLAQPRLDDFVFTVALGLNSSPLTKSYKFADFNEFSIPWGPLLLSSTGSLHLNILCKSTDDSFDFFPMHSVVSSQYHFECDSPLIITSPFHLNRHQNSGLLIRNKSDIEIRADVAVKGVLRIISYGAFKNQGTLQSIESKGPVDDNGGDIYIVADSFVNEGKIECTASGRIYIFCREYINNGTMTPNPTVVLSKGALPQSFIDYFLFVLRSTPNRIVSPTDFYKNIGVHFDLKWIQDVVNHDILFKPSKYQQQRVIHRMWNELKIKFFEIVEVIRDSAFVNGETICLINQKSGTSRIAVEVADFVFAVGLGSNVSSMTKPHWFKDLRKFRIRWSQVLQFKADSLKLNLLCKAVDDSFDFVQIHSMVSPQYIFESGSPLMISESVKISPANKILRQNGALLIKNKCDVQIRSGTLMNGSGTRRNSDGGVLRIISTGNVRNQGILRCNGLDDGKGGDIYIVAESFVNEGHVECTPNGRIHIFCREYIDNGTITPNPKVQQATRALPQSLIDYLLFVLHSTPSRIVSPADFFKNIGVQFNLKWIQDVLNHDSLFQISKYQQQRVIRRMWTELKIKFFEIVEVIRDSAVVHQDIVCLISQNDLRKPVRATGFVFAVCLGSNFFSMTKPQRFKDLRKLRIQWTQVLQSNAESLKLNLLCKAADGFFLQIHSMVLSEYIFKSGSPLMISESVNIPPSNKKLHQNGCLVIKNKSQVGIRTDVIINADGVKENSGGGVIRIISECKVRNQGTLSCNGLGDGEGGDIYIVADSFVNDGKIECIPNGRIYIFCREYTNNGSITPNPKVVRTSEPMPRSMIDYLLSVLQSTPKRIFSAKNFYKEIGLRFHNEWCPAVLNHELYCEKTQYEGVTVKERLVKELKIQFFKIAEVIREYAIVDGDNVVLCCDDYVRADDFVLAIGLGTLSSNRTKALRFGDLRNFSVPWSPLLRCQSDSIILNLFIKPRDGPFDFILSHSLVSSQYFFENDSPLIITESVKVPLFNEARHQKGTLLIKNKSNIEIGTKVVINGNGVKEKKRGGVMRIISSGTVRNKGTLQCNGLGDAKGGNIYIVAGRFVNLGKMECTPNGRIYIFCREYINNGTIIPNPVVQETPRPRSQCLIDYFLSVLQSTSKPIVFPADFYYEIGFRFHDQWCPAILNHKLYCKKTQCNGLTIKERLVKELKIPFFLTLEMIRQSAIVDGDNVVICCNDTKLENFRPSDFVLSIGLGTNPSIKTKALRFGDTGNFTAPWSSLLQCRADSLLLNLFIKPRDFRFDFVLSHSLVSSQYVFEIPSPLIITESMNIPSLNATRQQNGTLLIKNKSDIEIRPNVLINGNGVRENNHGALLRFISSGTVKNHGTLQCNGMGGGKGGDIYIVADMFVNHGNIECTPHGRIYIFCRKYLNNGTINPNPKVKEATKALPQSFIDYFLAMVGSTPNPIVSPVDFYKNIGVRFDDQWNQNMLNHELLFRPSGYRGKRVIDKLATELNVRFFAVFHSIKNRICVKKGQCVYRESFRKKRSKHHPDHNKNDIDPESIAYMAFTVAIDAVDAANGDLYVFESLDDFAIPIPAVFQSRSEAYSLSFHVYCRQMNGYSEFIRVATLGQSSEVAFSRNSPFRFSQSVKIPTSDPLQCRGGSLKVTCPVGIIIAENVTIDASKTREITAREAAGFQRNSSISTSERMKQQKCMEFVKEIEATYTYKEGAVGGDITLCSNGEITNKGILLSNSTGSATRAQVIKSFFSSKTEVIQVGGVPYRGGNVVIVANRFVNSGRVECRDGSVRIICNDYVNSGTIIPEPLVIRINGNNPILSNTKVFSGAEWSIPLKIYDFWGYRSNSHPKNVLDSDDSTFYQSLWVWQRRVGDWIMFKLQNESPVIPSQLTLKMDGTLAGVTAIALWMGSDEGSCQWFKLCDDIRNINYRSSSRQILNLNLKVSGQELLKKKPNLLLMEVLGIPQPPPADPNVEHKHDDYTKVLPPWTKLISFGLQGARYVEFYDLFRDAFDVQDQNVIYRSSKKRVHDDDIKGIKKSDSSLLLVSHLAFTITFGDDDPAKNNLFSFKRLSDLSIPVQAAIRNDTKRQCLSLHVHSMVLGENVRFERIGTIILSQYVFNRTTPLIIGESVSLREIDNKWRGTDCLDIRCSSGITVSKKVVIDASHLRTVTWRDVRRLSRSGTARWKRMQQPKCLVSDVGAEIRCTKPKRAAAGGNIILHSYGDVRIDGELISNSSDNLYRGGTITIIADSFINNGKIQCNTNGKVYITCNHFTNNGTIEPEPIVKRPKNVDDDEKERATNAGDPITLKVYDFKNDKECRYHPGNLLSDNHEQFYIWRGLGADDWVIFEMVDNDFVIPSAVTVTNEINLNGTGVKNMRLWIGKDNGDWKQLCEDITVREQTQTLP